MSVRDNELPDIQVASHFLTLAKMYKSNSQVQKSKTLTAEIKQLFTPMFEIKSENGDLLFERFVE